MRQGLITFRTGTHNPYTIYAVGPTYKPYEHQDNVRREWRADQMRHPDDIRNLQHEPEACELCDLYSPEDADGIDAVITFVERRPAAKHRGGGSCLVTALLITVVIAALIVAVVPF